MCLRLPKFIRPLPVMLAGVGMLMLFAGGSLAQQKAPPSAARAPESSTRWSTTDQDLGMMEIDSVSASASPGKRARAIRELRFICCYDESGGQNLG